MHSNEQIPSPLVSQTVSQSASPSVSQAPELTKLLQKKSAFQIQPPPVQVQKSQKSPRTLRRRLSADEVLIRPTKNGRMKRRHSIKPQVQSKKRPIFILTDAEIQKNYCLSLSLGILSQFVSRIGIAQRQTNAPSRQSCATNSSQQTSTLYTPPFPGPFQAIDDGFFSAPHSNASSPPLSACMYSNSNSAFPFEKLDNFAHWSDGSQYGHSMEEETPQSAQTWPNTPESDLGSDDLNSIEPSSNLFASDTNGIPLSTFGDYDACDFDFLNGCEI